MPFYEQVIVVNYTLQGGIQFNATWNATIFIHENRFENIAHIVSAPVC